MRVVVQRVQRASVQVNGEIVGAISTGLLLLVGFGRGDGPALLQPMAEKICKMRIFTDENGRFNRSLEELGGELLVVSQFTLYADTSQGRRPGFSGALDPESARALFDQFVEVCENLPVARVARGIFGAYMEVELVNDGPVTIVLESEM